MKTNIITNSTILVTGGAGFIGSYLIEELLQYSPKKIIIVDDMIRGSHENMKSFKDHPAIEFIEGDIRNTRLMDDCVSRSQYVFHMASLRINACAADHREGFDVLGTATFNLIESCEKHGIKKIIYSSSASVYGLAQNFPTPETDNPYDNQTFYGAIKMFGELILRSYKFAHNLDYVSLRYFNVYGERMDTHGKYTEVMIKWLDCIRDGKPPLIYGDGSDSMDFVHVQDVARANVLALLSDATDVACNIGTCVETSLAQLLDALLRINNSNLKPEHRPANSVNPVSRRLAGISRAQKLLGYEPMVPLDEGLLRLSHWYFDKTKTN